MSKIRIMDEILANKIAAGEVVEKCASVVKELVENSIDAQSTEIKIVLIDAGVRQIKVVDNGTGMDEEDAKIAFFRHATSKIHDEEDLFRINTLGFRGEALASIASVSKVELKTSDGKSGTILNINGGKMSSIKKADLRKGTEITVKDLFYNTPARLKHLKSLYTELANITDCINKISLSHPNIRFILTNNDHTLLNTSGSNNQLKVISAIYGVTVAKNMLKICAENADYEIDGYVSKPEIQRSNRNNMITIVNGRVVKNNQLNKTINDSYHSYKPDNRYPITVINITVDPTIIDVNIHPTKMDIKFSKMEELLDLISNEIRKLLGNKTLIPEVKSKENIQEYQLNIERQSKISDIKEEYTTAELITNDNIGLDLPIVKDNIDQLKEIKEEINSRMPELYPVGLVHGTYIVCQNDKGMYLIDQHAAKERINYELIKNKLANPNNDYIEMLIPITIELTNKDFIILKENKHILDNLKIKIEEFGINSIIVKTNPTWIKEGLEENYIRKIIEIIIEQEKDFSLAKFNDRVAATLACKASIKANTNISIAEMEQLINDLRNCDNPFNCPHGRPTTIFYSTDDLEKLFKRSGFDNIK